MGICENVCGRSSVCTAEALPPSLICHKRGSQSISPSHDCLALLGAEWRASAIK